MTIIRVIDFETTGMAPPAEIIEVGVCDLTGGPEAGWEVGSPASWVCYVTSNPPEARAVHHIPTPPDHLAKADPAQMTADAQSDGVAAWAAHNADFERQWMTDGSMTANLPLICTYKAALRVWPDAPSHSNAALRYWLEDQGKITVDHDLTQPAHRAGPDAYVTAHLLKALLAETTGREMVAWTKEPRLLPTCPLGKERGKKWAEVDGGFLQWMTRQETMEADLKWLAQRELDRRAADQSR